jgi:catechol 2,3-dioxygenase-like lactoylglutathione lyase family enzyme
MNAVGRSSVGAFEHVGVTVPSLDDAIGFFTDVIGWTLILREGPFADAEGDWMRAALNVDRSASLSFALLDTGARRYIELFEYAAFKVTAARIHTPPTGRQHRRRHLDHVS